MVKLKKGDRITLLRGDSPLQVAVISRHKPTWYRCVERYDAASVFLIDAEKENVGWMRGWSEKTSNALLASAVMAEPAQPKANPHLPMLGAAVANITSRVATAVFGANPIVSAALGGLASLYVTEKLKPKKP